MGGPEAVVTKARESYEKGDLRWTAEVLSHVVFADPEHVEARALLADTFEQLGYGAENGTWRCAYLSGAHELRKGSFGTPISPVSPDVLAALSPAQLFDSMAVRVNGPRCWDERIAIDLDLGHAGRYRLRLANGVLTHSTAVQPTPPDVTLRMPHMALPALIMGGALTPESLADLGVEVGGDLGAVARLVAALDDPDPDFAIVTP
jgi:alkyl sulfatase BDS1-like metallo-beta-lactamase superfamily hydrolase